MEEEEPVIGKHGNGDSGVRRVAAYYSGTP